MHKDSKKRGHVVEVVSVGALERDFPAATIAESVAMYLDAKASDGLALVSNGSAPAGLMFVFKAV